MLAARVARAEGAVRAGEEKAAGMAASVAAARFYNSCPLRARARLQNRV